MTSILIFSPAIVIVASTFFYNSPAMILAFIASLVISAKAYTSNKDEKNSDLGGALCFFCAIGATALIYQNRASLNADAAFVLYASTLVLIDTFLKKRDDKT